MENLSVIRLTQRFYDNICPWKVYRSDGMLMAGCGSIEKAIHLCDYLNKTRLNGKSFSIIIPGEENENHKSKS
jgi:hypothetical protein